jgi:hypothetical protein
MQKGIPQYNNMIKKKKAKYLSLKKKRMQKRTEPTKG